MPNSKLPAVPPAPARPIGVDPDVVSQFTEEEVEFWRRTWEEFRRQRLTYAEVFRNAWRVVCAKYPRLRGVSLAYPDPSLRSGLRPERLCWFCFHGHEGRLIRFREATMLFPQVLAEQPAIYVPLCIDCWQSMVPKRKPEDMPTVLIPPEPRYMP